MMDPTQNLRVVVGGGGKLAEVIWMIEEEVICAGEGDQQGRREKEREWDRQGRREKEEICFFFLNMDQSGPYMKSDGTTWKSSSGPHTSGPQ